MKSLIYFTFGLLLLSSCSNTKIHFEEAQPEHKKSLNKIPSKFHGSYSVLNGNALLIRFNEKFEKDDEVGDFNQLEQQVFINSEEITNEINGFLKLEFSAFTEKTDDLKKAPIETVLDSLLIECFNDPQYTYTYLGIKDKQLVYNLKLKDSMFKIGPDQKVKKWKKHVFLNKLTKNGWATFALKKEDNQVSIGNIGAEGKQIMKNIVNDDFLAAPSKEEMSDFIEQNGFNDKSILRKKN